MSEESFEAANSGTPALPSTATPTPSGPSSETNTSSDTNTSTKPVTTLGKSTATPSPAHLTRQPVPVALEQQTGADGSKREARKQQTRATLIRLARKFTYDRGLGGFTLEELCDAANISRRTFFNHFASKDDAVLGMPKHSPFEAHSEKFLSSAGTIPLVEALQALIADSIEEVASSEFTPDKLMALIHREPGLVNRLQHNGFRTASEVEAMICRREGLPIGDAYARTVAFITHHLTMWALAPPPEPGESPRTSPRISQDRESFMAEFSDRLAHLRQFLNEPQGGNS